MRVMLGSGPFGPIFHGVWQSLQPPRVTRYLPRSTGLAACCADDPWQLAVMAAAATRPRTGTTFLITLLLPFRHSPESRRQVPRIETARIAKENGARRIPIPV